MITNSVTIWLFCSLYSYNLRRVDWYPTEMCMVPSNLCLCLFIWTCWW